MKADQWSGLVTKASPYILPPGAAVEQVNLTTAIPGQLTCRNGMRRVIGKTGVPGVRDCAAWDTADGTALVVLLPDGGLEIVLSPALAAEPAFPSEPALSLAASQTGTTYTQRWVTGEAAEPPPAAAPATKSNELDGLASTLSVPSVGLMDGGGGVEPLLSVADGVAVAWGGNLSFTAFGRGRSYPYGVAGQDSPTLIVGGDAPATYPTPVVTLPPA